MKYRRDAVWLALIALLLRLGVVAWAWGRVPAVADGFYYHRLAERLAAGHGYTWLWPDGAVTYAAHYPIGYPAWLAAAYTAFGASPEVAMVFNALAGAFGVWCVHRILSRYRRRRLALGGALLVAVHPALVMYTPAVMTEGLVATLLAMATLLVLRVRERHCSRWSWFGWRLALAVCFAVSVLVRPQCLLLAPLFGALAWAGPRRPRAPLVGGLVTLGLCLALLSPWTYRNCERMGDCALVSVNGGWNLLIGTQAAGRGAWSPIDVPPACRAVFDEAAKDRCFMMAARERIVADPVSWIRLLPAKLAVTFDYSGAPGWYLHEANPTLFTARHKWWLGAIETAYERLLLMLAWFGLLPLVAGTRAGPWGASLRGRLGRGALYGAILLAATPYGWLSVLLGLAGVALRPAALVRRPVLLGAFFFALLSVAFVHGVFFGAGRYFLPLFPLIATAAALGGARTLLLLRGAKSSNISV